MGARRSLLPLRLIPAAYDTALASGYFGEVIVRYQDGGEAKVHFFASRLKYSRWVEVTLVPDERVETLVRTLVDHLAAFGGIPLVAVFDRPKTIALRWGRDGVVTEWNPTFAGVALDLGLGVEVCWPYRPQEKGSVENLVGWVKGSFFKQRRFLTARTLSSSCGSGSSRPTPSARRARPACRRLRGSPRSGRACARSRSSRPTWRCASPSASGRRGWCCTTRIRLDAAGRDRRAGDPVPLPGSRPHRGRPVQRRARPAMAARRRALSCPSTVPSASPPCRGSAPVAISSGST